jgi:hypothetical protein
MLKDSIEIICGNPENYKTAKPLRPFDEGVLAFLVALSKKLINVREYSDVATFGFWCRKAALLKEKAAYDDVDLRLGRGLVFHIAPSNVAVNFAFSLAAGLLSGNANIVRLPSKIFPQVTIIANAINELISGEFAVLLPYICLIKYQIDKAITDELSLISDIRVIWGGDATIAEIRKSPLKPRASEITFADRYSVAVISAEKYLGTDEKAAIIKAFYNDTYLSDQNACTSPRIIFWQSKNRENLKNLNAAKAEFYERLHDLAAKDYTLSEVQAVGKLSALYKAASALNAEAIPTADNLLMRLTVAKLTENLTEYTYNSGFFFEFDIEELVEILPICGEKCQTLVTFGIEKHEIENSLETNRPKGIDRAVQIGHSMDFTLVWDGYDLIREMSRRISII